MEITWIILAIGFILLASRRFRPDFVVIATVVALQLSGSLTLEQALSGFSNPAVLTIAAFMILSYSARSIDWSPRWEAWLKFTGRNTGSLCFWAMWGSGLFAGLLQEEQSVGVLMPGTIRAGRQRGVPPSKLLLPLAYGALLGRTFWLVGSPAALLVVWAMSARGVKPFGVLDFFGVSVLLLGCASLFVAFVGHTALPRKRAEADPLDRFRIRQRMMEFVIRADSPLIGKALGEIRWATQSQVVILGVKRTHEPILAPPAQWQLAHGDVLIAMIDPDEVETLSASAGLEPVPGVALGQQDITRGDIELVEVVIRLESPLQGQTLRQVDFRRRYGLSVLAIARGREVLIEHIGNVPLQGGDVLLLQGDRRRVDLMLPEAKAIPLGERAVPKTTQGRSWWALGGVVTAIVLAATGWLTLLTSLLMMALVMSVLTRYPTRDAYRALDWPLLVLLAGVVPWATAMETSGLSTLLVDVLLGLWEDPNPYFVLTTLVALVVGLATLINAPIVAVLVPPLALGMAGKLGVNPEPFLMATVLAASLVFLWPVGHRTHILVQGSGGYLASDYAKLGAWLVATLGLLIMLVVPLLWPF